VKIALNC